MTAIKSHHTRIFEQHVATRRQELLEAMARGVPQDNYWTIVGWVRGLDEALELSEKADFQLSGDDDAGS